MALALGTTQGRTTLRLTDEERSRHLHVLGASGSGKSKLLEAMIQQDIKAGRGLCLIDPHGTLADAVVRWSAATGMNEYRRIHVIEPSALNWCAGFNPLRMDGSTETAVRVDAMVAACAQVWGGENTSATPLLKKCLRSVFYTLAVRELTLAEAPFLTSSQSDFRRTLIADLPNPAFDTTWQDFDALSRREFYEQFSSTNNRLLEFLSSPVVRRIVGQRESALDLKQVMDNGEIVIVNLASKGALSADNARLLGTLLTSELFLQALRRDEATARRWPFTLYVDECYDYLTTDIAKMLDQTRKFGLHLVLAHQHLGQLGDPQGPIYKGVMAGGQTKIVFGGLADDDADVMAREMFRSSFNLERPKHILDKPVVVDEVPYWLESESYGETVGVSFTSSRSENWGEASNFMSSGNESFGPDGRRLGTGTSAGFSEGMSNGGGRSSAEGSSRAWSSTSGRSQTLKPVREILPTAVYSLEEEKHLAIVKLRELPNQAAIVKRRGSFPVRFRPRDIPKALASDERVSRFLDSVRIASPYLLATEAAEAAIDDRATRLGVRHIEPEDDASFWSVAP